MKVYVCIFVLISALACAQELPKVSLSSKSAGNTWNASRDQSQEMAKDLQRQCPGVRVTDNEQDANYKIALNHIEVGLFIRDNQVAVTDMFGNLLSTKEKGSIKSGIKGACSLMVADWTNPAANRERLIGGINAEFKKSGIEGYAEIAGDELTVHSERANQMRFHMMLVDKAVMSIAKRAQLTKLVYTDDSEQKFEYDFTTEKIVASGTPAAPVPHAASMGETTANIPPH